MSASLGRRNFKTKTGEVIAIAQEKITPALVNGMPYTGVLNEEILFMQDKQTALSFVAKIPATGEYAGYITGLAYNEKDSFRGLELLKKNIQEDIFYVFSAATKEAYRR